MSYLELDEKVRATAGYLQDVGLAGERVLLLLQPGLEYLIAYLGCLYAGAIAVPAYPPEESRIERSLPRVQAIIKSASVRAAFADAALFEKRDQLGQLVPELDSLFWIRANLDVLPGPWEAPQINADTLAFLQFTSGSTGVPKGVKITHGNLLHNVWAMKHRMRQGEDSIMVSWVPPYHDMGLVVGTLLPLYAGFPTYLMSPATFVRSPFRWLEAISTYRATTSCAPNFAFELCIRKISAEQKSSLDLSSWTLALNGAEPVRQQTIENFSKAFESCGFREETFYPAFGMSDATAMVSGGPFGRSPLIFHADPAALADGRALENLSGGRPLVSCGPSIDGQDVLVVDPVRRLQLAAQEVGELWIHGPCVGHGYWGREEESVEVYGATLAGDDGRRFMRTGDLGFSHEGEIYLTGRLKDLIIIRGKNHYPQDIEATVQRAHKAMRPGCGIAFSLDVNDEERLVIVQELDERHVQAPGDALDTALRAVVAEHEVFPHALLLVAPGSIPKTSSGKLQRSACRDLFVRDLFKVVQKHHAEISLNNHPLSANSLIPMGERERFITYPREQQLRMLRVALLGHISAVLRIDPLLISADRPLSDLGFDSLTAIELKNRIEVSYRVLIPMTLLLQGASLFTLSEYIADQFNISDTTSFQSVTELSQENFPLSFGQQALWFLQQLVPDSSAYNVVLPILLRGPLDVARLRSCFEVIVARHSLLRAIFSASQGEPQQTILSEIPNVFEDVDGSGWSQEEILDYLTQESHRPFKLQTAPLFRVTLVRCAPDRHYVLLVAHHIVIDFWSMGVLFHELGKLYTSPGDPSQVNLPPLELDYSQYVSWQQKFLQSPEGERQELYWRKLLDGELPVLELPTDRPRPPLQSFHGSSRGFSLTSEQTSTLKKVASKHQVTPFVLLLAAFQLFLHQYTGQDDILVGTLTAGRSRAQLADLVGYFVNPVVIRAALSDEPFAAHLARVKSRVLEALRHQEYPFSRLVEKLLASRDPSRSPLFQVLFVLQRAPTLDERELTPFALQETGARMKMGALDIESIGLNQRAARFDLTLTMADGPVGFAGSFEYNSDMFNPSTIDRMIECFVELLDRIGQQPLMLTKTLKQIPPKEHRLQSDAWKQTIQPISTASLHARFEQQVDRSPDKIALTFNEQKLTFRELDKRANQLAHSLLRRGIQPQSLIGLCSERGVDLVVGILGILKAGAAYIPLDPAYPRDRLVFMLEDARASILLTHEAQLGELSFTGDTLCFDADSKEIASQSFERPAILSSPNNLAYVLYTSGSTGRPKGVMIEHRSVINFLDSMAERPGIKSSDVLLSVTSPSFDIFGLELFLPLLYGAHLVVAPRAATLDGTRLQTLLRAHQVTMMQATPSTWQLLVDSISASWPGVRALCGGEPLSPSLARTLLDRGLTLWNMYGPTETTIWSTCQQVTDATKITIGTAIANTFVYILDEQQNLVPTGVWGECYLGGAGVARGYLNRPDLTEERFPVDPFSSSPGARMYRTGDRVRRLSSGDFEFAGRVDFQVKIRGFRIELGEIESLLHTYDGVHQAVVHVKEISANNPQLVGYIIPSSDESTESRSLQEFLRKRLPDYMVPRYFVYLSAFPLTPNGKINRKALPMPAVRLFSDSEMPVSRRRLTETRLARIWSSLLGLPHVMPLDNFFELGGHSLLVIRLIAQCKQEFDVDCPVAAIFNAPTLDKMSQLIDKLMLRQPIELVEQKDWLTDDIFLDEEISGEKRSLATSKDVFFTGGTGFLGAFLLRELLDRQDARVFSLVRAKNAEAGMARLRKNLERFHIWREGDEARIIPVVGDLALPRFGLSEPDYEKLSSQAGWILHNGAVVDFVKPYSQLRDANVSGTREIFRFATDQNLKPVHFVSTVSVFPPQPTGTRRRELESSPLLFDGSKIHGGYAQSKWVSDRIALIARERGIPVTIYRPGSILGANGMGNVDDIFHIIVKGCVQLGMVPQVDMWANFTPTDFVAPAITALSLKSDAAGGSYHLVNSIPVPWGRLCAQMLRLGYQVREVPYDQWREAIENAARDGTDVSLVRVLPFFQVPAETFRLPWFDDQEARRHLVPLGISCTEASDEFLAMWLGNLVTSGFLPTP